MFCIHSTCVLVGVGDYYSSYNILDHSFTLITAFSNEVFIVLTFSFVSPGKR